MGERRLERRGRRPLQVDRRRHDLAASSRNGFRRRRGHRPDQPRPSPRPIRAASTPRWPSPAARASTAPTTPARPGPGSPTPARPGASAAATCPASPSIRPTPTSSSSPRPSPGNRPTAAGPSGPSRARRAATTTRTSGSIPTNPDIILYASDQGAIITVNGGETWSSWYNQPTAQLYHVAADNAFPYRVYSGQQESGSAGVASRGDDGQITFREWHPVGVDEYGYAAPDPLDPDIVYGGRGVTRYDRRTGQVQTVGPRRRPAAPTGGRCAPSRSSSRRSIRGRSFSRRTRSGRRANGGQSLDADQPRPDPQDLGRAGERRQVQGRAVGQARPSAASSTPSRRPTSTSTSSGSAPTTA